MVKRPQLLAYLNGMPDIESTYPILARLHARDKIQVRAIVYSKQLRKEPRLPEAFRRHGFIPESGSKLSMKLFFKRAIDESDAVLSIADPLWDSTTRKQRGTYIRKIGKPSIWLQHGAYQLGVNGPLIDEPMSYYSERLLFWERLGDNRTLFTPDVLKKINVVGFTKQNILPTRSWGPEVEAWKTRYPRRLLVCQSFRWGNGRFSKQNIQHFYDVIEQTLERNPDLGIIIRPHRGKTRRNHAVHDDKLAKKYPNVLFSKHYFGPLAKASIHDVLDLCHAMISPTSTTVLDCVYSGKPVAIFDEGLEIFPQLPRITDPQSIDVFLSQIDKLSSEQLQLIDRFGSFNENLDRAASTIEQFMLG